MLSFLYRCQFRRKLEYCCHTWMGAAQSSPSSFERVQTHPWILGATEYLPLSNLSLSQAGSSEPCIRLSLFPWKVLERTICFCSERSVTARTSHVSYIVANHQHPLRIPSVRTSTRTPSFLKPRLCVVDSQVNVSPVTTIWNLFKSRVNYYIPLLSV